MSTNELILLGLIGVLAGNALFAWIYFSRKIKAIKEILQYMKDSHESRYELITERHWMLAREHYALLKYLGVKVEKQEAHTVVKKVTP